MIIGGRRASLLLFVGDLAAFALSLYLTLWLRHSALPSAVTLAPYIAPFSFLFALWTLVFYSAGLYGKRLALFTSRVPDAVIKTQAANILLAALFFFLIPVFGIAPKTILFLYLVVSLALILLWRLALYPRVSLPRSRERAALIALGPEADELYREVNGNNRYGIKFVARPALAALRDHMAFLRELEQSRPALLIVNATHPMVAPLTPIIDHLTRIERRCQLASFEELYEEVFDRIPLSRLGQVWFLENVASADTTVYAVMKRGVDVVGALAMAAVTILLVPFIALANALERPGPLFITQERFGRYGVPFKAYKFRSMEKNLAASGEWTHEGENRITRVGAFLRRTSLDEFPQFMNVLIGELSLVGPRSDILGLGRRLAEALPYYEARYLVLPGITGWAQINQQYEPGKVSPQSVEETKTRLAYDFYYLKHRSLGLDIVIALKTIKRMFFRMSTW